jgi:hypothetical protein
MEINTGERRLVSIRRFVPQHRRGEYADVWQSLHAAATARGAHAWHFVSSDTPGVFLEFLEFGPESDVRDDPQVLEAIRELHTEFGLPYPTPSTLEEWVEVATNRRDTQ